MSFADVVWFQVVTASLVDSHLAGLAAVPLTSKTPDTIFTLVTIGHLGGGGGEGGGEGGREEEIKGERKVRREGGRRIGVSGMLEPSDPQFISAVKQLT